MRSASRTGFLHVQRYSGGLLLLLLCLYQSAPCHAEVFTLGYLTGSQRRPGNLDYQRPGITISGAISLAVEQVNAGRLRSLGHSLQFVVAETFGDEVASIRQTAALWTQQVAAYIGPQETCVHEGRMAAAFNLPMISYVGGKFTILHPLQLINSQVPHSIAPIEILPTNWTFPLLPELDHRTHRSPSRWSHFCWPVIGPR